MKVAMSSAYKQVQPLLSFRDPFYRPKDKVVFVMGATGTGKSRLAIDLASHFPAEIINSDKMQVYKGRDIVTNKVTPRECRGVPHHLLGFVDPESDFAANDFQNHTWQAIESILGRDRLPIIAGGSNSFIDALVSDDPEFGLRYNCCFLWVDASPLELHSFVSERVDRMVDLGLVEEARDFYVPGADNTRGLRRAIGVSEMDEYLSTESTADDGTKARNSGQVNMMRSREMSTPRNEISAKVLLNGVWADVLFDTGATHSFISTEFQSSWEVLLPVSNNAMRIRVANGEEIMGNGIVRDCELIVGMMVTEADLAVMKLYGYDVILGMDWLRKYRAKIDCYRGEITIEAPGLGGTN